MSTAGAILGHTAGIVWGVVAWSGRHYKALSFPVGFAPAVWVFADRPDIAIAMVVLGWLLPALLCVGWALFRPHSWHRLVIGPLQRRRWRRWARGSWGHLARQCGLSRSYTVARRSLWNGAETEETRWVHPKLRRVATAGYTLTLTVSARTGQTSTDIAAVAKAIGAAGNAHTVTTFEESPSVVRIELVMVDHLVGERSSPTPTSAQVPVVVGRAESSVNTRWDPRACMSIALQGATRSGKSALCYGYLGALAWRKDVIVAGIDPTGILLTPFLPGRGGAWIAPTVKDSARVAAVLDAIVGHMDVRIADLVAARKDKITDFNECTPVVLVVLEEYPGLLRQLEADDAANGRPVKERIAPKVERSVGRIVKEGAKVGVTLLVLAQRMSAKAIDTDDRSNLPIRVTLRVDNGDAVRMLHDGVDAGGVEAVRQFPPGRGLYEAPGVPLQRFQAHNTTYDTYLARVAAGIRATASVVAFTPPAVVVPVPEPPVSKGKAA